MVKRMHAGRAAQSGLYAAQLASVLLYRIVNVFEKRIWRVLHDLFALARPLQPG